MPVSQIVTNSIANDAVTTVDIADLAVTPAKMSQKLTSDTAKTATSTSVDFTGIPSWAKRITVMFSSVSTNGSSSIQIQLGDSGGIETTGYLASGALLRDGLVAAVSNSTTGFVIGSIAAANVMNGSMVLSLIDASTNNWSASSNFANSNTATMTVGAGSKSLSATLDRLRITTVNGTDAFDLGTINILYE